MRKFDLTDRLQPAEKKYITIAGEDYEIDCSTNMLLKLYEAEKQKTNEFESVKIVLGEENYDKIMKIGFDITGLKVLAVTIMGLVQGLSDEQINANIDKAVGEQEKPVEDATPIYHGPNE